MKSIGIRNRFSSKSFDLSGYLLFFPDKINEYDPVEIIY